MRPLLAKADCVVAGDAEGPDTWAISEVKRSTAEYEQWWISGFVQTRFSHKVWSPYKTNDPLLRNRYMVEDVRDNYLRRGESVLCVGFVDPVPRTPGQRRTRGTDHTLRLARQAGIWCARYVWQGTEFVEGS
jgi:hypothetical protein